MSLKINIKFHLNDTNMKKMAEVIAKARSAEEGRRMWLGEAGTASVVGVPEGWRAGGEGNGVGIESD